MINFYVETDFKLVHSKELVKWIDTVIGKEQCNQGDISYIFCDDPYLLEINRKHLKHSDLTDIISFDYTVGKLISGDIFISVERVKENAKIYQDSFLNELHRVMIHGILHFIGYNDKIPNEKQLMREKEDYYLSLRTFID